MPRSSRHKSSKHSTRNVKGFSDSEKESALREKKGKEGGGSSSSSRHLKDLSSGEKRKLDSKSIDVSKESIDDEFGGSVLLSSSRKRKEKADDDRWTGGDDNNEHEMSKSEMKEKEKEVRDSKRSSRYVLGFDVEEGKKSGSKAENKHHRSERKERGEKEGGSERERKISRSEKLVDIVSVDENTGSERNRKQSGSREERDGKHSVGNTGKETCEKLVDIVSVSENTGNEGNRKQSFAGEERSVGNTDCSLQEEYKNPERERDLDRRVRRKRDGSGVGDRHHDAVRDPNDRRQSSREEISKSGRYKDDGHKEDKNRDPFQEYKDKDIWRQDEKQRDNRSTRDYTSERFDDKHLRYDKKDLDVSHKKSIPHSGEYDRDLDRDKGRDRDHGRDRDRSRLDHDRDRSRLDHDRDRVHVDRDHDQDRDRDFDRVHDQDRERDLDRVHDRDPEHDQDRECQRDRYRRELRDRVGVRGHDRGRERNFDHGHDNEHALHVGDKGFKYKDDRGRRRSPDGYDDYHSDKLRRVKTEVEKERSLSRKHNVDNITSSSRHRDSPRSRAYVGADKYRDGIQDETKYGDSVRDITMPEAVDKAPKYQSGEKRAKGDDNHIEESSERSPNTKVSPVGLKERSPSMSFDRSRFSSRNTRRRSLDMDDADRRSSGSNNVKDMSEDRQGLSSKKFLRDEYPPAESPFYNKNNSGQSNVSSHGPGPGPSVFRTRADSPSFVSSFGEDSRGPVNRYRRSVDPNVGRGPGNPWNGVPNWHSQLPNGFMPFTPGPPGPHHGGFPPIIPQFPPPFGIRPYHLADGDRFPVHVRPIGWPNMMEGSIPPHFHGWDAGNGMLRDDSSVYGPGHLAQRRDMNSDIWKQNGDMNMDVISGSQKDGPTIKASTDEGSSAHGASKPIVESSFLDDQVTSFKKDVSSGQSPMIETLLTPAKGCNDKTPESSGVDDTAQLLRAYLGKLDISMDLADPELYNQWINLAIKGKSEYVEDEVELEFMEVVVKSEITNTTVDMKIFPSAKESIFQKAMSLYKTQSSERSSVVPDEDNIYSPSSSHPEMEQTSVLKANIEIIPTTREGEMEEPVPMAGGEVTNDRLLQNSDSALYIGDETQMPVLDAEKMEEEASLELIPENLDKGDLSVERTDPDPLTSNADEDIIDDCGKIGGVDSAPGEQLDVAVSGSLIVCNDSVKVCEPLTSGSNESESVVLSRIHDVPGSTH